MERLTYRTELGVSIDNNEDCPSCNICWNCNIPPKECKYISDALKKLADYEDLEEQVRLVKLPCKVGDIVYKIDRISDKIKQHKVIHFETDRVDFDNYDYCFLHHFGKTVFLSEEEAEAKLKDIM